MDLLELGVPWWEFILRNVVIYLAFLLALRLFGKREVGQFTLFDLALLLLVANALQPAMTGPDNSLIGGLVLLVVLFLVNRLVAYLDLESPRLSGLIEGHPTIIARDGHWIDRALERERISKEDCNLALREHGYDDVKKVRMAVLETDGTISIVPGSAPVYETHRKVKSTRHR